MIRAPASLSVRDERPRGAGVREIPIRLVPRITSLVDGGSSTGYRRLTMNDKDSCCAPDTSTDIAGTEPGTVEDIARVSKALAHPIRVRIVQLLLARETCLCGQIVDELPVSQATVSQHLKVLRDAGLIRGEIDGPRVCYCADRAALGRHAELLGALVGAHPNHELEVSR